MLLYNLPCCSLLNKKEYYMTQRDMAGLLKITPMTLRNWRKDKPYLYGIIMKGFAFENMIDKAKKNYNELIKLNMEIEESLKTTKIIPK